MQFKSLVFDNNGMSSIYPSLVTYYNICRSAEQVGYFAFSFVAPLGTDYNYVSQGS